MAAVTICSDFGAQKNKVQHTAWPSQGAAVTTRSQPVKQFYKLYIHHEKQDSDSDNCQQPGILGKNQCLRWEEFLTGQSLSQF